MNTNMEQVKAKHNGSILETDIADVTFPKEIKDLGGTESPLCLTKILGGSYRKPLDNLFGNWRPYRSEVGLLKVCGPIWP